MEVPAIAGARDWFPRFVAIGGIGIPRSRKIGSTQERDALVLLLNYAEAAFDVILRAHKDFEHKCLRGARTPAERLHIQRLSTKDILVEAYADARP